MDSDRYKDVGDSHVACFVPQLYAAELLAKAGYRLCIVSDFAVRVYGLDNMIAADLVFAICDDQISDAAAYLLSHDFKKVPFERRGTETVEDDAKTLVDQIVTARVQPRYLEHCHMQWIYSGMIVLCPEDLRERLPPENQFFIKYFYKMLSHSDRADICRLRQADCRAQVEAATTKLLVTSYPAMANPSVDITARVLLAMANVKSENVIEAINKLALVENIPHFIVVGGGAMRLMGNERHTADIDILIESSERDSFLAYLRKHKHLVRADNRTAVQFDSSIEPVPLDVLVELAGGLRYGDVKHLTAPCHSTTILRPDIALGIKIQTWYLREDDEHGEHKSRGNLSTVRGQQFLPSV
ncbi:predicted protein [Histoplasma mississippiense (nom. inval.)]|uniref:predicted protein n=1 Tax=Ajellomyces capsulatus (strain NAm1 / WU24) TaxID=2059318 RepID=UPI000157C294|nr:predicted protein [Histoplasma mississippiense (nom. inval.)]EDN07418.1 predicted protein [Histoplasma mississippiense (nom. inval.)]